MKRALPYAAVGVVVLLGCDPTPSGNRVALSDTTAADTATEAFTAPPGRGFRMMGHQIVADTFEVRHELRDGRLTLVLDTDLGDNTEVFVSIARSYRIRGNSEDYIIEYFNEAGPVGRWRAGKTIDLTSTDFWAEVAKLQRAMAAQGEPFVVAHVADSLKLDFNVYPSQNAPFDSGNANLTGKAVSSSWGNRVIEKDLFIRYPVGEAMAGKPVM